MRITMSISRKTRLSWVNTVNRIRHQLHLQHRPQPRVEVVTLKNGRKMGIIEY